MSTALNETGYPVPPAQVKAIQLIVDEMGRLGLLQSAVGSAAFSAITGIPADNAALSAALATKAGLTSPITGYTLGANSVLAPSDTLLDAFGKLQAQIVGIGGGVSDGAKGDITVSGSGTVWTIPAGVISNAKLGNMASKTYKGNSAGAAAAPTDVPVATLKTDLALVKADVGLSNVDNTSDANKPVSTAQAAADASVASTAAGNLTAHTGNTANPHAVTKAQVGLGNVDNTSDANKPVSTAQAAAIAAIVADDLVASTTVAPSKTAVNTALATKQATLVSATNIKTINGASVLGSGDLVVTGTGVSDGTKGDIVVSAGATVYTVGNNAISNAKQATMPTKTYKGNTTGGTANPTDVPVATLKTDLALVKADVGLSNVDNTSDVNKPVSTAQQTAIDAKVANDLAASTSVAPSKSAVNGALATKLDATAPVALTAATTLYKTDHGNRPLSYSGANANLTLASDAVATAAGKALWAFGDAIDVVTLAGSAGVPTIVTPDGKSIVGSVTKEIGASCKAGDSWVVGTTDPASATATGALTASGYTMSTAKLIGRTTAATGAPEEIAIGSNLTMTAGTLSAAGGSTVLLTGGIDGGAANTSYTNAAIDGGTA